MKNDDKRLEESKTTNCLMASVGKMDTTQTEIRATKVCCNNYFQKNVKAKIQKSQCHECKSKCQH